eukprot:TRINITY_DN116_c1_g1_i2.p5 TRINITY_DN116_c1_g1~~TRINITY_DN116_c1_g1_i2.p5  ORF type:complete len:130 (-),score=18.04 TRINITY_DN116_c1_g1_i2:496-885(-)
MGCFIIYVYVFTLVYRFFRGMPNLKGNDQVLKRVSLRFLLQGFCLLSLMVPGIFVVTKYFHTALGLSLVHSSIYFLMNAGSSCAITSFWQRPGIKNGPSTKSGGLSPINSASYRSASNYAVANSAQSQV